MSASITAKTSVYAWGSATLVGNASAEATVDVQGNGTIGGATLTLTSGATNAGTILLQSATGSGYRSNLSVPSGVNFDNTGTIQVTRRTSRAS